MRWTPALLAWALLQTAIAAEPPGTSFDIRINLADQREMHLAATVPGGTAHRLQVDGDLSLDLKTTPMAIGGQWLEASLVSTANGTGRKLALADWPVRPDEMARVQWVTFSVCGDRFIAVRDAAPGRCADLPPLSKPDRLYGRCGIGGAVCTGPYEAMPAKISSHERIAPVAEPGDPLTVTGRVLDAGGRPRAGIIVYAYQTDRLGIYPPVFPPRSNASNYHGRLRGWARSDSQGRYTFDTIRPGSYGGNPEHIHLHVVEPGCASYIIDELMFADDPNLLRFTPEQRAEMAPGHGGSGVGTLQRKGNGWRVTRDVHLGEKIPEYQTCTAKD
jgi:protocatechuate 3,4-dioxygenase beta subunit